MRSRRLSGWWIVPLLSVATLGAAAVETPLIEAVKTSDIKTVRELIQQRVDVNAAAVDGTTALHWAAQQNDAEAVELLIRGGAAVGTANRYGATPLSLAAANGNAAVIELLVKAGADANSASPEGETALMVASRSGAPAALKVLLANGAGVNTKEGWREQTALMWAAAEGHAAAVKVLVENGADIHAQSKGAMTALLFAVRGGHIAATRELLAAKANVRDTAPDGTSTLVLAIINGHYELASVLLDHGADPNVDDPRASALHAIAWIRNSGYAAGNPPKIQTGDLDSLDLAKALLAHGANPNVRVAWKEIRFNRDAGAVKQPPDIPIGRNYMSAIGATPFYLAAKGGDVALMRLLAANGADPRLPTVQKVTPLMAASGVGFWDGESPGPESGVSESQSLEAVKLAWELGNDVNAVTDYGDIHLEGDGVTLLRRHPFNLADFPEEALGDMRWGGSSALHGAALRGANSIVQFLVDKDAKVDAKNKLGWTPLIVAEGVFVANTEKHWPSTVALLKRLSSLPEASAAR